MLNYEGKDMTHQEIIFLMDNACVYSASNTRRRNKMEIIGTQV